MNKLVEEEEFEKFKYGSDDSADSDTINRHLKEIEE
jgi:hypothetical protein